MSRYAAAPIPVFVGPSLAGCRLAEVFDRRPPAQAGDLLRLLSGPPCTVVLVDGLFDEARAPWHKEILVLLARGFRVIGAASLGALRAAELAPFGMVGAGSIWRAYADGRIAGDDEVALLHAPAELGGAALTLAQVDVRATLVAALRGRAIEPDLARRVRAISAAVHFRDRTWPAVLDAARSAGLSLDAFAQWLPGGAVDAKRRDAHAALALAVALAPNPPEPGAMPPLSAFIRALADECGVSL